MTQAEREDPTPAQRWGAALRAAQLARGVPSKSLAAAIGVNPGSVSALRRGLKLPLMETAHRIAEALVTPSLELLAAALRTTRCEVCDRDFIESHRGGYSQKWCSWNCEWTGRYRRRLRISRDDAHERTALWRNVAERRQVAVDAMCRTCEPLGTCKDGGCPLRPVSPLPLVGRVRVPVAARGTIRREDTPERAQHRRAQRAEWARMKRARVETAA